MKRFWAWAFIVLMVFSVSASAAQVAISNDLTEEQVAKIQLEAAKMAADNKTKPVTAQQAQEWAAVAEQVGNGIVIIAEKAGVAVNDFVQTPVGLIAIGLLVFNYAGSAIVHVGVGMLWFATLVPIWLWLYRRKFIVKDIRTYDPKQREDGMKKEIIPWSKSEINGDVHVGFMFIAVLILLIGVAITFTW